MCWLQLVAIRSPPRTREVEFCQDSHLNHGLWEAQVSTWFRNWWLPGSVAKQCAGHHHRDVLWQGEPRLRAHSAGLRPSIQLQTGDGRELRCERVLSARRFFLDSHTILCMHPTLAVAQIPQLWRTKGAVESRAHEHGHEEHGHEEHGHEEHGHAEDHPAREL